MYYFFYCLSFLQFEKETKKKLRVLCVYLYYDLYYVTVLCIVLSKHYTIMVKKRETKM